MTNIFSTFMRMADSPLVFARRPKIRARGGGT